ncbi:MAG: hypothetical protein V1917_01380 [Candidatus Gottesmanbacteria bacterium]
MKLLLHGEHIEASREEYIRLKLSFGAKEIRELNGRQMDESILIQAVQSNSLFSEGTVVCIEQLFGPLGKKAKQAAVYATIIKEADPSSTILLWEQKEIGKEILALLGNDVPSRLFSYPKIIFSFLDSLKPEGAKQTLSFLDELLLTEPAELVWSMTISRVRVLIQVKDDASPVRVSPWQLGRLTNQARLFTMDKLLHMHKTLLTMEYSFKNGSSPFTMPENIKQLVLSI